MSYRLVDDALIERLEGDKQEREGWLFLEPHPDFVGHWIVQSLEPSYMFDLKEVVGPYRAVAPSGLKDFIAEVVQRGYEVAFFEDPTRILDAYERLHEKPEIALASDFEGTVNGLLPYQVQGYNFLKDLTGGVAMWSTGTGKTVLASALLKYHVSLSDFDTAFVVVKTHNKVNTQRALSRLAGIDSLVLEGEKKRRRKLYADLAAGEGNVVVTNYEKFRVDQEDLLPLFEDRRVLCIWDEMPTKLKTRTTQIYKAVCGCLYTTNPPQVRADRQRPRSLRQYMLSATPIENDPSDFFNCVRLLDPSIYGTVKEFESEYVASYNWFDPHKPESWHKLDKMGLKASHITHQVDKDDPDIASQFPEAIEEPFYIDWDEKDRKIYDLLTKEAESIELGDVNAVALITVLQMLCDAPSMITNSAARHEAYLDAVQDWMDFDEWGSEPVKQGSALAASLCDAIGSELTDERHTKLHALRELLCETHSQEKVLVFSAFNEGLMPILESHFREWGVSYTRYAGSPNEKQAAQDLFMSDPDVQVFLTSDMGSDSLNLEAGSVCIHYDLPWKWSTKIQRQNRIHRVTSTFEKVRYYTLMMANSVEDRKAKIIGRKQGYHQGVFKGAIADQSASARMSREDLLYILRG